MSNNGHIFSSCHSLIVCHPRGCTLAGAAASSSVAAVTSAPWAMHFRISHCSDKFVSECRALTNKVGNGIATLLVSWWEGALDRHKLTSSLSRSGQREEEAK
jgi:aerobic C4-dicarboxylate transport protein